MSLTSAERARRVRDRRKAGIAPDPVKRRAGLIGVEVRWSDHAPKVVSLRGLSDENRRIIARFVWTVRHKEEAA